MFKVSYDVYSFIFSVVCVPLLFIAALVSRLYPKKIDIGIGPEAFVSHAYHKSALELCGYSVETYVTSLFYITEKFDKLFLNKYSRKSPLFYFFTLIQSNKLFASLYVLFHYKALYIYFNGGVMSFLPGFAWRFEPFIYRLANIKTVVMPYGSDIQEMSRSKNLLYKHCLSIDYPEHRLRRKLIEKKIDLWTSYGDFIISGVEWVDYMYHWDRVMLGHFAIDMDVIKPDKVQNSQQIANNTLTILHAPNHAAIKGTSYLEDAINRLLDEGYDIELNILQKVSNDKIIEAINNADLVADQFIIGWYAMFAIEAMASEKPVLCYLRPDLLKFYEDAQIIDEGEIPLINCSVGEIYSTIKALYNDREKLQNIGVESRKFVMKFHSLEAIGKHLVQINKSIGLFNDDHKISEMKSD